MGMYLDHLWRMLILEFLELLDLSGLGNIFRVLLNVPLASEL